MKWPKGIVVVLAIMVGILLLAAPALASVELNSYEKQLVNLINKERARRDLPKLRIHSRLVNAARGHSAEMGEAKYFDHDSADGERWSSRVVRYGYRFAKAGENIFYGANLYSSPYVVMYGDDMKAGAKDRQVFGWMDSKDHRAVILTKAFRDIGIGAVKTDTGYDDIDGTVWFFTMDVGRRAQ